MEIFPVHPNTHGIKLNGIKTNEYNKIKNASHKGEKDFPEMDKIWSRVEGKLNNTIVVQEKKQWQKLAITVTVLLSFYIIYPLCKLV